MTVAHPMSSKVAGTWRAMTDTTGLLSRNEVPQSPCSSRQAQSKYCTHSGRSSPSWAAMRSLSSCVMPASSAYCAIGPPGIRLSTTKPMIDTITSSTMLCMKRLSRNSAMVLSFRD